MGGRPRFQFMVATVIVDNRYNCIFLTRFLVNT